MLLGCWFFSFIIIFLIQEILYVYFIKSCIFERCINTVGNIFSGQVVGETAKTLSKRFGKNEFRQ